MATKPTPPPAIPSGVPIDLIGGASYQERAEPQTMRDIIGATATAEVAARDALIEVELDANQQAALASLEQQHRDIADRLNVPADQFAALPDWAKGAVIAMTAPKENTASPFEDPGPIDAFRLGQNVGGDGARLVDRQAWDRALRDVSDYNPKTHVIMVRRERTYITPQGPRTYHPGLGPVPLREMARKIQEGWRVSPKFPLLPAGTLPCPVNGVMGERCPYKGNDQEELDVHMTHYHPTEFEAMQRRRTTNAQEASTQTLQDLVRVLVKKELGADAQQAA